MLSSSNVIQHLCNFAGLSFFPPSPQCIAGMVKEFYQELAESEMFHVI